MNGPILITGGTGFVGSALAEKLSRMGYHVRVTTRGQTKCLADHIDVVRTCTIDSKTDWKAALKDVRTVIHCAARVHEMNESGKRRSSEYMRVNYKATIKLARDSISSGVEKFIFISTIKVNGEGNQDAIFRSTDKPNPTGPYAVSKAYAESELTKMCADTPMRTIIIRSPLVYGNGVGGNFSRIYRMVKKRIPLPLKNANNKRSLIYIKNLVEIIVRCVELEFSENKLMLVSDDDDVSISELVLAISRSLGIKPRLFHVPSSVIWLLLVLLGRKNVYLRLFESLLVDSSDTFSYLQFTPSYNVEEALRDMTTSDLPFAG